MQPNTTPISKNTPSIVETHVESVNDTNNPNSNSLEQLDSIFQSVKRQINQWGANAKWKIDLVLLDNPNQQDPSDIPDNRQRHPLLSPQQLHPNAITAPYNKRTSFSLPITSTTQYPWDYVAPKTNDYVEQSDELSRKLHESLERQRYLESIVWAQADQIKHTAANHYSNDGAINTMKNVFLLSQNEQKMQYAVETSRLQKDVDMLSKKLGKMASILEDIENLDLTAEEKEMDKDALLNDRKTLLRKLRLAELRLSARDAEINYLHEVIHTVKSHHGVGQNGTFSKKSRRGPPYLFQQQFSPRSDIRSSEQHHLSALDSLGIVADQMLSDPEFEGHHDTPPVEKRVRSRLGDRRSQRSIDSAATLLAMPQLMVPQKIIEEELKQSPSSSPELHKVNTFDHIPKKPRSTYTRWTEAEDKLLRAAVKKYGHSNWEACSKEIQGRSNIQCRNRWIRHLEHKPVPPEEAAASTGDEKPAMKLDVDNNSARHSPSIAALLNSNNDDENYHFSPKATPRQLPQNAPSASSYLQPTYRPPSPIATPKNKRKAPDSLPIN